MDKPLSIRPRKVAAPSPDWNDDVPLSVHAEVDSQNAMMLAYLRLEDEGFTPGIHGEGSPDKNSDTRAQRLTEEQRVPAQQKWNQSHEKWKNGFGPGWKGTKVLGQGGNGIAGLWTYEGADGAQGRHFQGLKHVVVKQGRPKGGHGLKMEGTWQKQLCQITEHVPRMYKRVYREPGTGAPLLRIDSRLREVHRIFMEYCEGGDISNGLIKNGKEQNPDGSFKFLREDKVWSIFLCLAKCIHAFHKGTEIPGNPAWELLGVVHFDIKNLNVFLGGRDSDEKSEHYRMPIAKVGDFGMMRRTMPDFLQNHAYLERHKFFGTRMFLAPEQHRDSFRRDEKGQVIDNDQLPDSKRNIGSHTNIFQLGAAIFCLMTLRDLYDYKGETFSLSWNETLSKGGHTAGKDLITGVWEPDNEYRVESFVDLTKIEDIELIPVPYSDKLKTLVFECLLQDYHYRPKTDDLVRRAQEGYEDAMRQWPDPDNYTAVSTAPDLRGKDPAEWFSKTPLDYWEKAEAKLSVAFKPLHAILARQERDLDRRTQVHNARKKLRLPIHKHPDKMDKDEIKEHDRYIFELRWKQKIAEAKEAQLAAGKKRGRDDDEPDDEPYEGEDGAVYPSWYRPTKKINKKRELFKLTVIIHRRDKGPDFTEQYVIECYLDMTIGDLKDELRGMGHVIFRRDNIRIAATSIPSPLGFYVRSHDFPDEMTVEECAKPKVNSSETASARAARVKKTNEDVEYGLYSPPIIGPLREGTLHIFQRQTVPIVNHEEQWEGIKVLPHYISFYDML